MGPSDSANPATASGVRWLLLSLGLAAVADLVMDVPVYFGTALPELEALFMTASYQLYAPILSVVVPTGVGLIGFAGILRIERGRGWTREWRGERARPAFFVAAAAALFLFGSGLVVELVYGPVEAVWNPVRMTVRFVVGTFAAAARMLIAIYNGFFASESPVDFMSSQVEPLLSPAAFLFAVVSLFGWFAVYNRILGRLAWVRARGTPQPRLAFSPHPHASPVRSQPAFATATSRPPGPARPPGSTRPATSRDPLEGPGP